MHSSLNWGYNRNTNRRASRPVFIGTDMPEIKVRDSENIESALRKFKRACEDAGIFNELRKREYYEKPTWRRVRLRKAAEARTRSEQRRTDVTRRKRNY